MGPTTNDSKLWFSWFGNKFQDLIFVFREGSLWSTRSSALAHVGFGCNHSLLARNWVGSKFLVIILLRGRTAGGRVLRSGSRHTVCHFLPTTQEGSYLSDIKCPIRRSHVRYCRCGWERAPLDTYIDTGGTLCGWLKRRCQCFTER